MILTDIVLIVEPILSLGLVIGGMLAVMSCVLGFDWDERDESVQHQG
jgi:hypothetical protein